MMSISRYFSANSLKNIFPKSTFLWLAIFAVVILMVGSPSVRAAPTEQQQDAVQELNGFDRDARAPKPKFIRFGRAGQKFIRFGRSGNTMDYVNDFDPATLTAEAEFLAPQFRQFQTAPKRAQKFIRFGK
ncbi:FMRFamide-like neuropeptide 5 [Ditylenchus destructor]|uniref:FMRFamide-like neuropeptide 5 n=1 Tax=Ditylenchus destructor TaxID=166010 RepID=A0AAD4N8J6_9BILA|nr:FMRFamide-like neuropeptide 5 [Ditylenchus destructor]